MKRGEWYRESSTRKMPFVDGRLISCLDSELLASLKLAFINSATFRCEDICTSSLSDLEIP